VCSAAVLPKLSIPSVQATLTFRNSACALQLLLNPTRGFLGDPDAGADRVQTSGSLPPARHQHTHRPSPLYCNRTALLHQNPFSKFHMQEGLGILKSSATDLIYWEVWLPHSNMDWISLHRRPWHQQPVQTSWCLGILSTSNLPTGVWFKHRNVYFCLSTCNWENV